MEYTSSASPDWRIPYAILLRFFFRSPVPNFERNNKISLTGPTQVGEKEANFGLRILFNIVACTPRVFIHKNACAYSQFVLLPFELSPVATGNTRWTRSITGTGEGSTLYPFRQPCHLTSMIERWTLEEFLEPLSSKGTNLINPRLGRSKMWI